jgi:uncharacterized cofD-like protein
MSPRIAVLGGGHGVAAVLRALRIWETDLTVIVTIADDGGSSGELRTLWGGAAVGDMRRSLIALTGEAGMSGRALAGPVTIARFGEHPLGNLVLHSLAQAFGDLETASEWLSGQLGVDARVLPATTEPVTLVAAACGQVVRGETAIGTAPGRVESLSFEPHRPAVPPAAADAITTADWVILGPGSLFTSVLAVSALPDIRSAIAATRAQVLWICNLCPQRPETAGMSSGDHHAALRDHGVRVDAVLYDPAAQLHPSQEDLAGWGLRALGRPLASRIPSCHDPALLSAALEELFSGEPPDPQNGVSRSTGERFPPNRPMGTEVRRRDSRNTDALRCTPIPQSACQ